MNTHAIYYKDQATGQVELLAVNAQDAKRAAEAMGSAKGFYAGSEYIRGLDVLKVEATVALTANAGSRWCGRCENGWTFRMDPDPVYKGCRLASPCSCNPEGQQIVREEREKEAARLQSRRDGDWQPSASRREEIADKLAMIKDNLEASTGVEGWQERKDAYAAEVARYRANGKVLTPDQRARLQGNGGS